MLPSWRNRRIGTTAQILVSVFLLVFALAARGQDHELFRDFQASKLTQADKTFLQAALALEGYYDGLLDGEWGPNSQGSLERFSWDTFETGPQDWHMAMLAFPLVDWLSEGSWGYQYLEDLGVSVLVPFDATVWDEATGPFVNFHHEGSSLAYSMARSNHADALGFHDYTYRWHEREGEPFVVRSDHLLVTSAAKRDGSILYTRSDLVRGGWSTTILSAAEADGRVLGTVSASISVGSANPISPTRGGHLDTTIRKVIEVLQDGEPGSPSESGSAPSGATGSGFFVSVAGHVLTNAHVVDGCRSISVDGSPARKLGISEDMDLAVLTTDGQAQGGFARFSPGPARLNSDVTVGGYPYAGVLGGFTVTRGTVSSSKGIGGDTTRFQITAPVQSGSSGGPVIASDGEVVGVVVSKLDKAFLDRFGEIPQNVNFAVSGETAKLFLSRHGVTPAIGRNDATLGPEALADIAADMTVLIECK